MSGPVSAPPCEHIDGYEAPKRADHFFDGRLTIAPGSALEHFASFFAIVLAHEVERKRKRKASDAEVVGTVIRSIVANLAYPLIAGLELPAVAIPLAKPSVRTSKRYPPPPGINAVPRLVAQLADRRLLDLIKSRKKGMASSITAHESLVRFVSDQKLTTADLVRKAGRQTIVLRHVETFWNDSRRYTEFDYADTPETCRMRSEMAVINARLSQPRIQMIDKPPGLDLSQREMRRCFITSADGEERFDLGGRLWGGFWPNISRDRRRDLFMEAERVADIDFISMYVRLTYLKAGLTPPDGDLYARILPGHLEARYRPAVKVCVSAMLSTDKPFSKRPRGLKEPFPVGWSAKTFREAILRRHAPIAHLFETGIGSSLMRTESDILVDALLAMDREGFAALPMHDGLMVPRRYAQRAECIMGDAAERQTGFRLPTKCKLL